MLAICSFAAGAQTYSTQAACKNCGWVESCNWVEPTDPVLVGAATSGRFTAQGQPVPTAKGSPALTGSGGLVVQAGPTTPPHYEIRIRMADGSLRAVQQPEALPLGAEVRMQGNVARLLHD
jgi:hypothetical protein